MRNSAMVCVIFMLASCFAFPNEKSQLANNAALRYYAAFAELQDFPVTNEQAQQLNGTVEGSIPYDDSKLHDLVQKNRSALELMTRGASLSSCDWGLDYDLGENTPVDYARNALALGRLNVLYVAHLQAVHDSAGAVSELVAGLRFSHDVANGGSLFATVVAKDLLAQHLRMVRAVIGTPLSDSQKNELERAVAALGADGLDWESALRKEMDVLQEHFASNASASLALARIKPIYIAAVNEHEKLPALQRGLASAPLQLSEALPHPDRVIREQEDLRKQIRETRAIMQ